MATTIMDCPMDGGYKIVIVKHEHSLMQHYCAYVGMPKTHVLAAAFDFSEKDYVNCHGGVTYEGDFLLPFFTEKDWASYRWIGWDYAHAWDYHPVVCPSGRKYSVDEIRHACISVIVQLNEYKAHAIGR